MPAQCECRSGDEGSSHRGINPLTPADRSGALPEEIRPFRVQSLQHALHSLCAWRGAAGGSVVPCRRQQPLVQLHVLPC